MSNEYNIQFFDTLAEAFSYQNAHGGTLYIKGDTSASGYEYEVAAYIAEAPEEETRRFIVVDDYIREIIERPSFNLKGRGGEVMRLFDECRFFATEEEARAFMKELDEKQWGYYWAGFDGMPDIADYEETEGFLAWICEEDRYILAAMIYGLTEEEMIAKPHCILMYSEEFNTIHQRNLKIIEERLKEKE